MLCDAGAKLPIGAVPHLSQSHASGTWRRFAEERSFGIGLEKQISSLPTSPVLVTTPVNWGTPSGTAQLVLGLLAGVPAEDPLRDGQSCGDGTELPIAANDGLNWGVGLLLGLRRRPVDTGLTL
jgi:hypothetical protein